MRNKRNRRIGSALTAEFGPALFVFFMIILFPMINLIGLAMGAGTLYLMAVQCATKAGDSTNFADALANAETAANSYAVSGFGQFAKLTPVGGYNSSGMDLFITDTNINTNVSTTNGPNTPFVSAIDRDNYLYTYDARVTYNVGPFMSLGAVPWIGSIPGVGVPARLTMTCSRNIEHPEGLQLGGGNGSTGGGGGDTPRIDPGNGVGPDIPSNPGGGDGPDFGDGNVGTPGPGGPPGDGNNNMQ